MGRRLHGEETGNTGIVGDDFASIVSTILFDELSQRLGMVDAKLEHQPTAGRRYSGA